MKTFFSKIYYLVFLKYVILVAYVGENADGNYVYRTSDNKYIVSKELISVPTFDTRVKYEKNGMMYI